MLLVHLRGKDKNGKSACYEPAISCHFSSKKQDITCVKCKLTSEYKNKN